MSEIEAYRKLLTYRRYSKRIVQLSYTLSQFERDFRFEDLSPSEKKSMLKAYEQILTELIELSNEYKLELETTDSN